MSNHSARRVNLLGKQLNATRYLEIGVSAGKTFSGVEIAERTGVDPNFVFDTKELENESTRLIADTSDNFFSSQSHLPPYDIVFIDGLHTFEQVVRDFSNALLRTHWGSAIVIDDTLPIDVYSAIPDMATALRHRKATGSDSQAWHGDVFKIIFYIHDFWPSLNYRTITGSGNPQTLVWRADGIRRPPLFDNLEKISRLTYFDMKDHFEIFKVASESEAIELCVSKSNA